MSVSNPTSYNSIQDISREGMGIGKLVCDGRGVGKILCGNADVGKILCYGTDMGERLCEVPDAGNHKFNAKIPIASRN